MIDTVRVLPFSIGFTIPEDFVPETLSERAVEWSRRPWSEPIDEIVLHPGIHHLQRGAASGVIDAEADGLENLRSHRPTHADAGRRAFVCRIAKEMGLLPFSTVVPAFR